MKSLNMTPLVYTIIHYMGGLGMFIVFTSPNRFVKSYNKAVQIAYDYYNKTGEIVAVERSQHHPYSEVN